MGRIEYPIDGKKATTIYKQLPWTDRRGVWLQLHPITGRKHQLRIHCAKYLEAPIYGDAKYRKLLSLPPIPTDRLYLHANHIQFLNPFHSTQEISVSSRKSIYSNTSK
jgi:23S rRNA-/tRNA-specific pseudouridylate synthase